MTVASKLSILIQRAVEHLEHAPDGNLPLGYREAIWAELGARLSDAGRRRRTRLALFTARAVESVSRDDAASSDLFDRAMAAAERLMFEPLRSGSDLAAALWEEVVSVRQHGPASIAATVAVKAAIVATHDETFRAENVDLARPDDINIAYGDAAYFAARALSGPADDPCSDLVARRGFFTWWLKQAVPAAYESEGT
jgi:hypothetical protein